MSYGMPCIVVIGFAKLWLGLGNYIQISVKSKGRLKATPYLHL